MVCNSDPWRENYEPHKALSSLQDHSAQLTLQSNVTTGKRIFEINTLQSSIKHEVEKTYLTTIQLLISTVYNQ